MQNKIDMRRILKLIICVLLDFTGIRFMFEKILPPKDSEGYRKPSTFVFWFVGIYVAFFGVASQRYENKIDVIENRTTVIFSQLATDAKAFAISRVPNVQNTKIPLKPEILDPLSIFISLFGKGVFYNETIELLKDAVVGQQKHLIGIHLENVNLEASDLRMANLHHANLKGANLKQSNLENAGINYIILEGADLTGANCKKVDFGNANLKNANFENCDLSAAHFNYADCENANFKSAIIDNAYFYSANLSNVKGITLRQLSKVKSLYKATGIDQNLIEKIRELNPYLLEHPNQKANEG